MTICFTDVEKKEIAPDTPCTCLWQLGECVLQSGQATVEYSIRPFDQQLQEEHYCYNESDETPASSQFTIIMFLRLHQ